MSSPAAPVPKSPLSKHKITVRAAIPSDISSFPEMKVRTWNETYAAFGVPQWWLDEPPQEEEFRAGFPERIANLARKTWIAYDGDEGKVVGYATAEAKPNKNGYIDIRAVYVLKEYQGISIGRRLVEGVVGEKDCRAVVETLVVNEGARRFYGKLGFTRIVGETPSEMGGVDLPGIILARDAGGDETPLDSIHLKD